jgi:serpin B
VGAVVVAAAILLPLHNSPSQSFPHAFAPNRELYVVGHSQSAVELAANIAPTSPHISPDAEDQVAMAEQAFSLSLLRQLNAQGSSTSNVVTSPSSLATVLAMLELGARGATSSQIAAVLGTSKLNSAQQAAEWNALSSNEAQAARQAGIDLASANSLWLQKALRLDPSFMSALSREFATGVWQVDFDRHSTQANAAINSWVSSQTHGLITQLFEPGAINSQTALVLANAIYFKGAWQTEFDPSKTKDQIFYPATGGKEHIPFMISSTETLRVSPYLRPGAKPKHGVVSKSDILPYQAVELPYKGGRFAALAIMPTSETLASFVGGLTPSSLSQLIGTMESGERKVVMPRFQLSDTHNLNGALQTLGMTDAFGNADLSGISPNPPGPLVLQQVQQRAFLKVDEQGTQAAASSGAGVEATALQIPIILAHPFLFLVRDTKTGAILFSAEVENPATS